MYTMLEYISQISTSLKCLTLTNFCGIDQFTDVSALQFVYIHIYKYIELLYNGRVYVIIQDILIKFKWYGKSKLSDMHTLRCLCVKLFRYIIQNGNVFIQHPLYTIALLELNNMHANNNAETFLHSVMHWYLSTTIWLSKIKKKLYIHILFWSTWMFEIDKSSNKVKLFIKL